MAARPRYAWEASGFSVPTILQAKVNGSQGATGTKPRSNYANAPRNGSLLLAFGFIFNSSQPSPVNSWKVMKFVATTNWYLVCYYKYANNTPNAENIDNGTFSEWCMNQYEIAGVTGDINKDVPFVTLGTQASTAPPYAAGNLATQPGTSIVLSSFQGNQGIGNSPNFTNNTGWTQDAIFSGPSDPFSISTFGICGHRNVSNAVTVSSTAGSNGSGAWSAIYVELGQNKGPWPDQADAGANATTTTTLVAGGTITGIINYSTSEAGKVVVAFGFNSAASGAPFTPSCTSPHLTFTQRASHSVGNGMWYEYVADSPGALTAEAITCSITCTGAGTPGASELGAIAMNIVGGKQTFDTNVSFPANQAAPTNWTTDLAPDLVFTAQINTASTTIPFVASPYKNGIGAGSTGFVIAWSYTDVLTAGPGSTPAGTTASAGFVDAIH